VQGQAGEQLTILTSDDSNPQIVATCRIAATQIGAVVSLLNLPPMNGERR
jgi:2,5-dihydroxypyridine 5,6-dioxygenase